MNFPNCPESLLRGVGWLWAGGSCVRTEQPLGPWAQMKYCALRYGSQCCKTKRTQIIQLVFSVNLLLTCCGETILKNVTVLVLTLFPLAISILPIYNLGVGSGSGHHYVPW